MEKLDRLIEFETKYRVDQGLLIEFKSIMASLDGLKKFISVEGGDEYFVKGEQFLRYRKAAFGMDNGRTEVTMKTKPVGAKNNIIRREWNWRVDNTEPETIREGIKDLGFTFNFSIYKICHIYNFKDATVVFYTVYDTTDKKPSGIDTFVEIEVSEKNIGKLTENQAWEIIEKYESILAPMGITPQKRLKKSLFEMYER